MTKKVYSFQLQENIEARIPKSILDAVRREGWNFFGIYEVVKEEIKKEKKQAKA